MRKKWRRSVKSVSSGTERTVENENAGNVRWPDRRARATKTRRRIESNVTTSCKRHAGISPAHGVERTGNTAVWRKQRMCFRAACA
eukprot:IDg15068t1